MCAFVGLPNTPRRGIPYAEVEFQIMHDFKQETILQVGADGGTIAILRRHISDGSWRFFKKISESFHADLLSEEEQEGLGFHTQDTCYESFSEALNLLREYPWHKLSPLRVHPEFRQSIYERVVELSNADEEPNENLSKWKTQCGMHVG